MGEVVSITGGLFAVRACTEKPGVWLEFWHPRRKQLPSEEITGIVRELGAAPEFVARLQERMRAEDEEAKSDEPDNYIFVPGDVRAEIGHAISTVPLEVEDDDAD